MGQPAAVRDAWVSRVNGYTKPDMKSSDHHICQARSNSGPSNVRVAARLAQHDWLSLDSATPDVGYHDVPKRQANEGRSAESGMFGSANAQDAADQTREAPCRVTACKIT